MNSIQIKLKEEVEKSNTLNNNQKTELCLKTISLNESDIKHFEKLFRNGFLFIDNGNNILFANEYVRKIICH